MGNNTHHFESAAGSHRNLDMLSVLGQFFGQKVKQDSQQKNLTMI